MYLEGRKDSDGLPTSALGGVSLFRSHYKLLTPKRQRERGFPLCLTKEKFTLSILSWGMVVFRMLGRRFGYPLVELLFFVCLFL